MTRFLWIAGALALSGTVAPAAAATPYAAHAPVQLHSGDGLHRLPLPLAVLQHSQRLDLNDVRVVDAGGAAVPLAWAAAAPVQSSIRHVAVPRFAWPASPSVSSAGAPPPVKVRIDARGAVVRIETGAASGSAPPAAQQWLLDLSQAPHRDSSTGERLAALRLDWTAPPGGATVRATLEASDDLQQWRDAGDALLLDAPGVGAAAGERLSVRRIEVPAHSATVKYLRLRLDPALPLQQVEAELQRSGEVARLDGAEVRFEPVGADGAATREWLLDLRGAVPLQRLQLELPQLNTVAAFRLERRNAVREPWQHVSTFTAYRLVRDGRELRSPVVELPSSPARHWRLRLDERSPELGKAALPARVQWSAPQLVFAARGEPPFMLQVGSADAASQNASLAQLIPGYRAGEEFRLPAATLGELTATVAAPQSWSERLSESTPAQRRRWALWAVLLSAVALLAWLARRLMRDMSAPPG